MKIVCEKCGETSSAASIRVDGEAVIVVCTTCGFENHLDAGADEETAERAPAETATDEETERTTAAQGPAEDDTPEEPTLAAADETADAAVEPTLAASDATSGDGPTLAPHKCPKCFHRQYEADFCERCGLNLSSHDASPEAWEKISDWLEEEAETARELWREVERSPSQEAPHEAFLAYCVDNQLLELAVRRYRGRLADLPDEQPTAAFAEKAAEKLEVYALSKIAPDNWSNELSQRISVIRKVLFGAAVVLVVAGFVIMVLMFRKQGTLMPGEP